MIRDRVTGPSTSFHRDRCGSDRDHDPGKVLIPTGYSKLEPVAPTTARAFYPTPITAASNRSTNREYSDASPFIEARASGLACPAHQSQNEEHLVILSELVCARLRALAPSLLFHGTGVMSAILADDEVGGDEGPGGIVAFDRAKLASLALIGNSPTLAWHPRDRLIYVPLYLLREYVVGAFWLDELSPAGRPGRPARGSRAVLRGTAVHGTGGRQLGSAPDAGLAGLDRGVDVADAPREHCPPQRPGSRAEGAVARGANCRSR